MCSCYFVIICPWSRRGPLFLKIWKPLTQGCFVTRLKLAQYFLRRRYFNFVNVFSLLRNYLPLEKCMAFILTNLNPHHLRMLCAKCGRNWPSGSWEDEIVKSLQTDRWMTDNRRSEKLTWIFNSGELKNLFTYFLFSSPELRVKVNFSDCL